MREWQAELVLDARAQLGECPLWSVAEQCLYWIDIAGRRLHRYDPATSLDRVWWVPCEPGCIALAEKGGLVAALRDGFYRFYPQEGLLDKLTDAPYDSRDMRFNDGHCDSAGRFWAGAMYEPRTAELAAMFCLERGATRLGWGPQQDLGVKVSNGLAFAADGQSLFQSDTPNHVIYRFAFDAASGQVGERKVFARLPAKGEDAVYGGRPDGAALDAEGCYWSAQYEGGRVLRFSPQGEIIGIVRVPVTRPTMIAFGGADLRTLYITSAREGASDDELARQPQAGGLFAVRLDVAGRPEPLYRD
ncbi:SMP-30/gluconolactonase/LRE family protein [Janthinobacterium sp. EB271-G4-7A]|uniref:SMP-30/gluconolactonase/LRE family protein n=1 Tax=Janthinobacterium sp. EB271-G4-7A TaxID=2775056 RepID=UPI001E2B6F1F|nr:SMP-30/gluconolactonase/LRE family protein [Janthinobacterium sp. EB271-G4-7A]MCC7696855.1 SMP-30/gluconolactonase/LRE family protein [Janthinobacterium sp. EB271-G4-7A]